MTDNKECYIGIDVGTGSARACIIDSKGEILALAAKDISKWEPKQDYFVSKQTNGQLNKSSRNKRC
jgi:ribulose kinase